MPAYLIYWFDQDDHVTEADYLIADADDDVRGGASYISKASAVEVWHWAVLSCEWRARSLPALLCSETSERSRPHSPLDYPLRSRRHPFEFIAIGGSQAVECHDPVFIGDTQQIVVREFVERRVTGRHRVTAFPTKAAKCLLSTLFISPSLKQAGRRPKQEAADSPPARSPDRTTAGRSQDRARSQEVPAERT